MTRYPLLFIVPGLLAASIAFGGAAPQSFLDGNPQTKTDPHLFTVRIVAIDGDIQQGNPVRLTAGPHLIAVIGPATAAHPTPKAQTVALKIQPCTYYYLGAHKDSPLMENWKLVVDAEETITSCNPSDEMKKMQTFAPPAPPKKNLP